MRLITRPRRDGGIVAVEAERLLLAVDSVDAGAGVKLVAAVGLLMEVLAEAADCVADGRAVGEETAGLAAVADEIVLPAEICDEDPQAAVSRAAAVRVVRLVPRISVRTPDHLLWPSLWSACGQRYGTGRRLRRALTGSDVH
ncbi:MAG TPA: hypothetical protein VIJ23_05860 [Mycobacterium sp.]